MRRHVSLTSLPFRVLAVQKGSALFHVFTAAQRMIIRSGDISVHGNGRRMYLHLYPVPAVYRLNTTSSSTMMQAESPTIHLTRLRKHRKTSPAIDTLRYSLERLQI